MILDSKERSPSKVCHKLTWDETFQICNKLVSEISPIRHKLHTIYAIANGGTVPAAFVAYKLRLDLEIIHDPPMDFRQGGVLLFDDVADSGLTLEKFVGDPRWHWGATAVLVAKPWCPYKTSYVGIESEDWIIFPWEDVV